MAKVLRTLRKKLVLYCVPCRGFTEHRRDMIHGGWIRTLCRNRQW